MADLDFEQHTANDIHFFSRHVPALLASSITASQNNPTIVDVGCGDGHLVWSINEAGLIAVGSNVIGIDISPRRIQRFRSLTGFEAILADGHLMPTLESASVDLALSTMVIEHIPDEHGHAEELARILKPGGLLYLSTVVRKRGAWYFRKAPDGRRVLDPTHLREYSSSSIVLEILESAGFLIKEKHLSRLIFPIAYPFIRWIHRKWPINDVQRFFLKRSTNWMEKFAVPIPRYRAIEIVAQKPFTSPNNRPLEDQI